MHRQTETTPDKESRKQTQSTATTSEQGHLQAPPIHPLLKLQRRIGNQAVRRLLQRQGPAPVPQPRFHILNPESVIWVRETGRTHVQALGEDHVIWQTSGDRNGTCQLRFGLQSGNHYAYYTVTWQVHFEATTNTLTVTGAGQVQRRQGETDPGGVVVMAHHHGNVLSVSLTARRDSFGVTELLEVEFMSTTEVERLEAALNQPANQGSAAPTAPTP